VVSAAVNLPLASRVSQDRRLTARLAVPILSVAALGVLGAVVQRVLAAYVSG
jgi:hypothetical protein